LAQVNQITRAAELETLSIFRDFIKDTCAGLPGINAQILYDLQLAVDEACTNVITHGYAGMNPGSIILAIEMHSEKVVIDLTDFGHQFEPSEAPMPDVEASLEGRPMGGFGLYIIYQTMDEISYETSEDGNCLTFVKNLSRIY